MSKARQSATAEAPYESPRGGVWKTVDSGAPPGVILGGVISAELAASTSRTGATFQRVYVTSVGFPVEEPLQLRQPRPGSGGAKAREALQPQPPTPRSPHHAVHASDGGRTTGMQHQVVSVPK